MIDHATEERRALVADLSAKTSLSGRALRIAWPIPKAPITKPIDDTVDTEYEARAAAAWAKTREIGGICG